eukprot:m.101789 g.101789  ORF g.101789 m.101789 type:complete len:539 (-) comp10408_c0_seq1:3362-4978(-)
MAASLSKEETIRQNERIAIDKIAKAQAEHQKGKFATSSGMTVEGERTATHASASQDKSVLHAGYLIKAPPIKGKVSIKGWKSRYFVLRKESVVLQYYGSKESFEEGEPPKGVIDLAVCDRPITRTRAGGAHDLQKQVGKKYANLITLSSPQRVYHFSAPSVKDAMTWATLLGDVHKKLQVPGLAPGRPDDDATLDEDDDEEVLTTTVPPNNKPGMSTAPTSGGPTLPQGTVLRPRGSGSGGTPAASGIATAHLASKMDRTHESREWFFGPMDRAETEEMLTEALASDGSGLFIVRSSETTGGFVMSWIGGTEGKITHTQVLELSDGTFKFKSKHGPPPQKSLTRLIECEEFRAMLRRADASFRREATGGTADDSGPVTQRSVPGGNGADNDADTGKIESFYLTHTPRDKRRRRPTTAASDAAMQLRKAQRENERLQQELNAAREFLAAQGDDNDTGADTHDAPPPIPPRATEFKTAEIHSQGSQRRKPSDGPLIVAPLAEQDLVSQLLLQQELRYKLEETYTRIRKFSGDFVEEDEEI